MPDRTPIRVLVVEDSPTTRQLLVAMLSSDPAFVVVGEAVNGAEGVEAALRLSPDLITMDVHMPVLDGLDATRQIMREAPTPIVIVSASVSATDVADALNATRAGALMIVAKPGDPRSPDFERDQDQFLAMAKAMATVKVVRRWGTRVANAPPRPMSAVGDKQTRLIAIGTSTGGPAVLQKILSDLPAEFPLPILVVQHMSHGFVGGLGKWLGANTNLHVELAEEGVLCRGGTVYLAPDDRHLGITPAGRIALSSAAATGGFRPSADFLFDSCARAYGNALAAFILTGMGQDGVEGLRTVRKVGGRIIAQDERSSVVFGMARETINNGLADEVLPADSMARRMLELARFEAAK